MRCRDVMCLLAVLMILTSGVAHAGTKSFKSGSWATAGNWVGGVPAAGDTVQFDANTTAGGSLTTLASLQDLNDILFTSSAGGAGDYTTTGINQKLGLRAGITMSAALKNYYLNLGTIGGTEREFDLMGNNIWNVGSGRTLRIGAGCFVTDSTSSYSLQITGGGIVQIDASANNNTTVDNGVSVDSSSTLAVNGVRALANATTLNDATLRVTADLNIGTKTLSLNSAASTVLVDPGITFTVGSVISGSGILTKTGTGTIVVSGANTYTGQTKVQGGVLDFNSIQNGGSTTANALGKPAAGSESVIQLNGSCTLKYTGSGHPSDRAVNLVGAGTIEASGSGALTLNNGTAAVSGSSFVLTLTGTGTGIVSKLDVAGLVKDGTGTWALTAGSTFTGGTTNKTGVLQIGGGNDRLPVTGTVTLGDGASGSAKLMLSDGTTARDQALAGLAVSGSGTDNRVVGGAAGISTLTLNIGSGTCTYGGLLGGVGTNENNLGLTKAGGGTLTLTAINTFTGPTIVNGGELDLNTTGGQSISGNLTISGGTAKLQQASQIASGKNLVVNSGTFDLQSYNQTVANVQITGGTIAGSGGVLTSSNPFDLQNGAVGAILGGGGVGANKTGAGTVTLTGVNTYDGLTTVSAGELDLGTSAGQSIAGNLAVSGGTAKLLQAGQIVNTKALTVSSGTFDLQSYSQTLGSVQIMGGTITGTVGVLTSTSAFDVQGGAIGAILGGSAGLNKSGGGAATLCGANTYGGVTTISNGTLTIVAGASIANSVSVDVQQGATLDVTAAGLAVGAAQVLKGKGTVSGNVTNNGTLSPGSSIGTFTVNGNLTLAAGSTNVFELTATNNLDRIVGIGTLRYGGTLVITNIGTLGAGTYDLLDFTGESGTFGAIILPPAPAGLQWHDFGSGVNFNYATGSVQLDVSASGAMPTLSTPTATAIGTTTATLGASVVTNNGAAITSWGTAWDNADPGQAHLLQGGTDDRAGAFSMSRSDLSPGQHYYACGWASNSIGAAFSTAIEFCTEPLPASAFTIDTVTSNSFRIAWTADATSTGTVVLVKQGGAVDGIPADGMTYTANAVFGSGTAIGSGNYVVYANTGNSVTVTGLTPGATYGIAAYACAGSGALIQYNTSGAPTASQRAKWLPPVLGSASALMATVATNSATLTASVTDGGGTNLVRWGTVWGNSPAPTGNVYTNSGSTNAPFTVSDARTGEFSPGQHYYVRGWADNGDYAAYSSDGEFYAEPNPAANPLFSNVQNTQLTVSWATNATMTGTLVVMKQGSAVDTDPVDGTACTASNVFASGAQLGAGNYVVYAGTGTNVTVTGLTTGQAYYVKLYAYAGSGALINYAQNVAAAMGSTAGGGTWTNTAASGNWTDSGNWSNAVVAVGSNNSANFSAVDLTADVAVHLNSALTIGNLIFGDTDTNTAASWTLDNNGGTGNLLTLAGTTPTVTVNAMGAGKNATVSTVVSGVNGLTKSGGGTLVLTGTNTYVGTTTISSGVLRAAYGVGITTGNFVMGQGGVYQATANMTKTNGITTPNSGGVGWGLTAYSPVVGTTITMDWGTNNYTAGGAGPVVTLNDSDATGPLVFKANIVSPSRHYLAVNSAAYPVTLTGLWSCAVANSSAHGKIGPGLLLLQGGASMTGIGGVMTVFEGTLIFDNCNYSGLDAVVVGKSYSTGTAATLNVNGASVLQAGLGKGLNIGAGASIGSSDGAVNVSTGGTLCVSKIYRGASAGTITFDNGVIRVLDSTNAASFMTGLSGAYIKAGGLTFDSNGFDPTVGQNLLTHGTSLGGGLVKLGAGNLTLCGTNTYTGLTDVQAGTLTLGAAGGTLANSAAVQISGGTLNVACADTVGTVTLLNGSISGAATLTGASYDVRKGTVSAGLGGNGVTLTKTTADTVTLSGINTYDGLTTVTLGELDLNTTSGQSIAGNLTLNGGTVKLLQASQIASSKNFVVNGGTFDLQGFNQIVGGVQLTGGALAGSGGVLTSTSAFDLQAGSVSASLGGSVGLNKTTGGTVTLSGMNSFSGVTSVTLGELDLNTMGGQSIAGNLAVNGGTVKLMQADQIAAAKTLAVSSGAFDLQSFNQTVAGVQLTGGTLAGSGGTLSSTSDFDLQAGAVGAILGGGVGLNKSGSGTVTLSGANSYGGGTTVTGGTLALSGAGALPSGTTLFIDGANAGFDMGGGSAAAGIVTLGQGTITNGALTASAYSLMNGTVSAILAGAAAPLAKDGVGTVTLSAANTYGGNTTIKAGTLTLSAGGSLGNTPLIDVQSGASLNVITPGLTLGAAQTLKGNGTVTGAVVNNGTLSPGASLGTLTVNGDLTLSVGGTSRFEITASNNLDRIVGVGVLTYGGTLSVTNVGTLSAGTYRLFSFTSQSGAFASIVLPTPPNGTEWHNFGGGVCFDYATGSIQLDLSAGGSTPTLSAPSVSVIGTTNAVVGASVVTNNGAAITSWGAAWDMAAPGQANLAVGGSDDRFGAFSVTRNDLAPGQHYFACGWASNAIGLNFSTPVEFYTRPLPASGLIVDAVTSNSFRIAWTADGSSAGTLVLVKQGGAVDATPADGSVYAASAALGAGDALGGGNSTWCYPAAARTSR